MKYYSSIRSIIRRSVAICIAALALPVSAENTIRSYVGIVREHYYDSLVQFMKKYSDKLRSNGYSTYAKYVDAYLEGGFGSGFVYVAPDGKNYIITNRHVVSQAETASVEFEDAETGRTTKYDGLTVVATDDDIDIAILAFPENQKPFTNGLSFSSAELHDGDEVWSAGFPGLGNNPVWQLGKGNVTNAKARIDDLLDTGISTLIQHSAQVDPGNSGGPLMVISKKDPAGYAVAGINTWKATYRESTNYSIPVQVVSDFINRSLDAKKTSDNAASVSDRAAKFLSVFARKDANFTAIVKYISYDMTAKQGEDAFEASYRFAPSSVRNIVNDVFSDDPFEGLRYAVAYQVWQQYRDADSTGETYTAGASAKKDDKTYTCAVSGKDEKTKIDTSWICEQGLWRLSESSAAGKNSSKKASAGASASSASAGFTVTAPTISTPYFISLQGGCIIGLKGKAAGSSNNQPAPEYSPRPAVNIQADFFLGNFGLWGFGAFANFEDIGSDTVKFIGFDATFRVPVNFTAFSIVPYAQAGAGLSWTAGFVDSESKKGLGFYGEAGAVFVLDPGWFMQPGIGIAYNYQAMRLNSTDYRKDSLKIYAVITF